MIGKTHKCFINHSFFSAMAIQNNEFNYLEVMKGLVLLMCRGGLTTHGAPGQ
ncbi:unnamed protein product [Staurois parvus]|uniref:Uncharacterized protein n=1 Tax=Staurois parvus TaxID=386267 RepID=A0ABN9CL51_9NEOB|nr:unnamed protein product [Staurois parvus]